MGYDLYRASAEARQIFDLADEVLDNDVKSFCFNGPVESLKQTAVTQPAIFAHSLAALEVLKRQGMRPDLVAGHSVGELAALVAAGVMRVEDGFRVVGVRGHAMQVAGKTRPGAMAAVLGLADDVLIQLCDDLRSSGHVTTANFNCPGQVVLSGEENAVKKALEKASALGAKRAVRLPVSGAFHSALMRPALAVLTDILDDVPFARARIPIIPNVTAKPTRDPDLLKNLLIKQVISPVRWTESMQCLAAEGVTHAIEVGPGTVLKGLMRRINRKIVVREAGTWEAIEKAGRREREEAGRREREDGRGEKLSQS